MPSALKHDRIYFTHAVHQDRRNQGKIVSYAAQFYLERKNEPKGFGAVVILFPVEFNLGELLETHYVSKEFCIANGLMIGALYRSNQAKSLNNPKYYPLRTPTPVLVIRDLVASDLLFLDPKHYSIRKRLVFLYAFIKRFEGEKSSAAKQEVAKARGMYRRYRIQHGIFHIGLCAAAIALL